MLRRLLTVSILILSAAWSAGQTNCSTYNSTTTTIPPFPWTTNDGMEEHNTGYHQGYSTLYGSCTYNGTTPGQNCNVTCVGTPAATTTVQDPLMEGETGVYEWGQLNTIVDEHFGGETASSGQAASNGPQVQCSANAAIAVMSCASRITCGTSITITVGASGIGASVSFPSGNIFAANTSYPITCAARTLPGLASISVTPANWTIWNVAGGDGAPTTQQYTATGTYSNGTTSTLTNVVWTSSNPSLATISSTGLAKSAGGVPEVIG